MTCVKDSKYRTIDGTCNNLEKKRQGAANTAFQRLLPAEYENGIDSPRGRLQAENFPFSPPTPSARQISMQVIRSCAPTETPFTHMMMQWGQFLDHDITLAPEAHDGCLTCAVTGNCEPIRIPENDPVFGNGKGSTNDGKCIAFRRSLPVCNPRPNTLYPREQINTLTSYVDGSQVYGSNVTIAKFLRSGNNGQLRVTNENLEFTVNDNPPLTNEHCLEFQDECYVAGDIRSNEQAGLLTMHTLFLREHNRIARELKRINQAWNDDTLYQEARRIVGAILQRITYEEYLRNLLGDLHDIVIRPHTGYKSSVDASIPNAFAAAAFRYGHSLIQPEFIRFPDDLYEKSNRKINPLNLQQSFFSLKAFRETGTDPIIRGLVTQPALRSDEFMNSILTEHLFEIKNPEGEILPGLDLAALNIQRGRDHGLPVYRYWADYCRHVYPKLPRPHLKYDNSMLKILKLYGSQDVIDLFVAGLAEERVSRSLIGPTFSCLFGITFSNLRDGDRFFYQHSGIFTPQQLTEINKVTLSRVICDNTAIKVIQPSAFLNNQSRVQCKSLPSMNLEVFSEKPDECFVKVSLQSAAPRSRYYFYYVVNYILRTRLPNITIAADKPQCVKVDCPTKKTFNRLQVTGYSDNKCQVTKNPKLPKNEAKKSYRNTYQGCVNTTHVNSGSGIYSSLALCQTSRSPAAVTINCPKSAAATVQEELNENMLLSGTMGPAKTETNKQDILLSFRDAINELEDQPDYVPSDANTESDLQSLPAVDDDAVDEEGLPPFTGPAESQDDTLVKDDVQGLTDPAVMSEKDDFEQLQDELSSSLNSDSPHDLTINHGYQ